MNDPRLVKRAIRELLSAAPTRWFTEQMLRNALNMGLLPQELKVPELQEAIAQLHERNLLESRHDPELEEVVWRVTGKGIA